MTSSNFSQDQLKHALIGVGTALVTPMCDTGEVDIIALDRLIDAQLESKVASLIALGTTAEAATLTQSERLKVMRQLIKRVAGRAAVLVGTGLQGTQATLEAQRIAQGEGADAGLVVTPFYNKPTQQGLLRHYETLASQNDLPLVLYNVPSRTGCDMAVSTIATLSKLPSVIGLKDATADLSRVTSLRSLVSPEFVLLSGDDPTACAFCLMGGQGVISVASNVAPAAMVKLIAAALSCDVQAARADQAKLMPLFLALSAQSNPIPIKAAMAAVNMMGPALRLPLTQLPDELLLPITDALAVLKKTEKA